MQKEDLMRHNRLRELLDDGKPSLGTRVMSPWPSVIEIVGHSGMFDYVEFVAEYSPFDLLISIFLRSLKTFCSIA